MMGQRPPKYIRVVVFDDEPVPIVGPVEGIGDQLKVEQNILVDVQSYRIDWCFQAQREIEKHHGVPMLWLIDLHQKFKLPDEMAADAKTVETRLDLEARNALKELRSSDSQPEVAAMLENRAMTPDGAAVIALARQGRITFRIVSSFSATAFTRPLISIVATGSKTTDPSQWELSKPDLISNAGSARQTLKNLISDYARELAEKRPRQLSRIEGSDQRSLKWYRDSRIWWAVLAGFIVPFLTLVATVYYGNKALVAYQESREAEEQRSRMNSEQPAYKSLLLKFKGKKPLDWDLVNGTLKELPQVDQIAELEAEPKKNSFYQRILWFRRGASEPPNVYASQRGTVSSSPSRPGIPLAPGVYFLLFYLTDEKPDSEVEQSLSTLLKSEVEKLSPEVDSLLFASFCDKGVVKSGLVGADGSMPWLEGMCRNLYAQIEEKSNSNDTIKVVAFRVQPGQPRVKH